MFPAHAGMNRVSPLTLALLPVGVPRTRGAYDADRRHFSVWCVSRGAQALSARQGIVAAYLSHLASSGLKASTIGRRCATIAGRHRQAGIDPSPTAAAGVHAVMKGIRRTLGTAPAKKSPATADVVMKMLAQCSDGLIGHRGNREASRYCPEQRLSRAGFHKNTPIARTSG